VTPSPPPPCLPACHGRSIAIRMNEDPTDACAVLSGRCGECAARAGCGYCGDGEYALEYHAAAVAGGGGAGAAAAIAGAMDAGAHVGGWIFKQKGLVAAAAAAVTAAAAESEAGHGGGAGLSQQDSGAGGKSAAARSAALTQRRNEGLERAAAQGPAALLEVAADTPAAPDGQVEDGDAVVYHLGCFNASRVLTPDALAAQDAPAQSASHGLPHQPGHRFALACRDFRTDVCDCGDPDVDASPQCAAVAAQVRTPPLVIAVALLAAGAIVAGVVAVQAAAGR
jgi:hypothetical protein